MAGEIIEVCQDCGHLIEPEEVTAPWGDHYRITLCQRDECLADRILADMRIALAVELHGEWYPRACGPHWWAGPTVNSPTSLIRITGV